MSDPSVPQVDRSVFRRLAFITTMTAVAVLLILTVFFALTVNPHFGSPELNHRLRSAHFALIGPVLLLVVGVILIAHQRLRRLMLPPLGVKISKARSVPCTTRRATGSRCCS